MIVALHALIGGEVDRIVLVRPVVEAGEALGFLPGDLEGEATSLSPPSFTTPWTKYWVLWKQENLLRQGWSK